MKNTATGEAAGDQAKPWSFFSGTIGKKQAVVIVVLFLGVAASGLVFINSTSYSLTSAMFSVSSHKNVENELEKVLSGAANANKTVIITTSNQAWAAPNSIVDLFLGSFDKGNGTKILLDNLVIVSLDHVAHAHCRNVHPHCYELKFEGGKSEKEAFFMTPVYLKMMWRRIEFLTTVLEMGYNFIFTDADIMWLQNPFPHFFHDADFQIACDNYNGNPDDLNNSPNGGFNYVLSNNKTIQFYKYWYSAREAHPRKHDQDVFNIIKHDAAVAEIGVRIKFLSTTYFGGFCEPSRNFNLVCTMHANCCVGLDSKVKDLKLVLEDWKRFNALNSSEKAVQSSSFRWSVPKNCRLKHY